MRKRLHPKVTIEIAFILMTILMIAVLIGFTWTLIDIDNISKSNKKLVQNTHHLTLENEDRIKEINRDRIYSCKHTYQGIRNAFKPFVPKNPPPGKQASDIKKFNHNINRLKRHCAKQVSPP